MFAIQLTKNVGNEVVSWWCEGDVHKTGFGAERFRKLYAEEGEAQKHLDYCRDWAYRHHRNTLRIRVKEIYDV